MIMASLAPTERSEDTRGLLNLHTVKLPIDVAKSHVTQHFTQYDDVLSTLDHAYSWHGTKSVFNKARGMERPAYLSLYTPDKAATR
jgi:hypothetical protein